MERDATLDSMSTLLGSWWTLLAVASALGAGTSTTLLFLLS